MGRLDLSDVLRTTFGTVFSNFGLFVRTQGPFVLAAGAIGLLQVVVAPFPVMEEDSFPTDPAAAFALLGPALAVGVVFGIVAGLVSLAGWAVGAHVADAALHGGKPTLGEAWTLARPRLVNLVLTSLLFAAAIFAVVAGSIGIGFGLVALTGFEDLAVMEPSAMLTLFVFYALAFGLAVWLALRWAVAPAVSVLETRRVTENLVRSAELTRGALFGVFLAWFVTFLAVAVASALVVSPVFVPMAAAADAGVAPPLWAQVTESVLSTAMALVTTPVLTTLSVVLYRRLSAPAPSETLER